MRTFSWLSTQTLQGFILLVAIDIIFFLFTYLYFFFGKSIPIYIDLLLLLVYGVLIWIAWKIYRYISGPIDKGMTGEYAVDKVLKKLPKDNFSTLHDVVIGKQGNIDFVVIGTTGVWTIEVKNHKAGKISLNNDGKLCRDDYPIDSESGRNVLSQAYGEANNLQKYIKETLEIFTPVHPVIVFANKSTELHFGYNRQKGVYVIGIPFLMNLIQNNNFDENFTSDNRLKIKDDLMKYTSKF